MRSKILVLDFGSQITQLIARRVREAHVYYEVYPNDTPNALVRDLTPRAIILSGNHASTYENHQLRTPRVVWDLDMSVSDICYSMQTMAV